MIDEVSKSFLDFLFTDAKQIYIVKDIKKVKKNKADEVFIRGHVDLATGCM